MLWKRLMPSVFVILSAASGVIVILTSTLQSGWLLHQKYFKKPCGSKDCKVTSLSKTKSALQGFTSPRWFPGPDLSSGTKDSTFKAIRGKSKYHHFSEMFWSSQFSPNVFRMSFVSNSRVSEGFSLGVKPSCSFAAALEQNWAANPGPNIQTSRGQTVCYDWASRTTGGVCFSRTVCVWVCVKRTHFQSYALFCGNCGERGKRADFCSSVGYNRTSQD